MITIKEIANIVGVSPTTVSNVIRGKKKEVSDELEKKIQSAIKEYNYIPNMSAINLAKNNSHVIAFVINSSLMNYINVVQDFFTAELIGGLEKGIREEGFYLMLHISDQMQELKKFINSWNIDGIIALGFSYSVAKELRNSFKKPIVFIDGYFDDKESEYINVGIEDYTGAYLMTRTIIEYGHTQLAFLADNFTGGDNERFRGFQDAIKDAGLPEASGQKFVIERNSKGVQHCVRKIKEEFTGLSALFFCSDHYAIEAMGYLMDLGVHIPDDMSIVGYDDTAAATLVRPKLATVHQSATKKAEIALKKLMQLIDGEKSVYSERLLCSLVIRESIKKKI